MTNIAVYISKALRKGPSSEKLKFKSVHQNERRAAVLNCIGLRRWRSVWVYPDADPAHEHGHRREPRHAEHEHGHRREPRHAD